MQIEIQISEKDLKQLVHRHIQEKTGQTVRLEDIKIETKSAQNYKSEWETALFRARYSATIQ